MSVFTPHPRSRAVRSILTVSFSGQEQSFLIEPGTVDIGRSLTSTIRIRHPEVSRRQATLVRNDEGNVKLIDGDGRGSKSTNGTYVNKARITDYWLKSGDIIHFGSGSVVAKFYQLTVQVPASQLGPTLSESQAKTKSAYEHHSVDQLTAIA